MKACLFGNGLAPQKQADLFFQQSARNPKAAFHNMAEEYQLLADETSFQILLEDINLADSKGLTWTDSHIDGSRAHLKGQLERPNRAPDDLEVTMIKKGRRWRVLRFEYAGPRKPPRAVSGAAAPDSLPAGQANTERPANRNNEEMIGLVKRHLQALVRALATDDFSGFHQMAAGLWRAQTSPAELQSAYAPLKPHAQLILDLASSGRFEITSINTGAQTGGVPVINVTGRVMTEDHQLRFTLKLVSERNRWLMVGLEAALY